MQTAALDGQLDDLSLSEDEGPALDGPPSEFASCQWPAAADASAAPSSFRGFIRHTVLGRRMPDRQRGPLRNEELPALGMLLSRHASRP